MILIRKGLFFAVVLMAGAAAPAALTILPGQAGNPSPPADFSNLSGPYLGRKPPGMTPEPFALPSSVEIGVFSPDGCELIFQTLSGMMVTRLDNGGWIPPQPAPFSGGDLNYAPDGRKVFFASNRALEKDGPPLPHLDIWVIQRTASGWSEPVSLGPPVNTEGHESSASMAENGNLYFFRYAGGGVAQVTNRGISIRPAGDRKAPAVDIFYSKFNGGRYAEPEKLGPEINSDAVDLDPFIAPDESYLIFHSNRPGGFGQMDFYISFRNRAGSWTPALNMGDTINSAASEAVGSVSGDGKYFFFSRSGRKYWVRTQFFEELRKTAFN